MVGEDHRERTVPSRAPPWRNPVLPFLYEPGNRHRQTLHARFDNATTWRGSPRCDDYCRRLVHRGLRSRQVYGHPCWRLLQRTCRGTPLVRSIGSQYLGAGPLGRGRISIRRIWALRCRRADENPSRSGVRHQDVRASRYPVHRP